MSTNNTNSLPRDRGGEALQEFPAPKKALQRITNENATASSVISVTHDTTSIEVAAITGSAAIRWVPQSETAAVSPFASVITIAGSTANYDHVIPTGTVRRFALPFETQGLQQGSVVGLNRGAGLYQRFAIKTFGIASVMTSEF